jgi:hypothetical protein
MLLKGLGSSWYKRAEWACVKISSCDESKEKFVPSKVIIAERSSLKVGPNTGSHGKKSFLEIRRNSKGKSGEQMSKHD